MRSTVGVARYEIKWDASQHPRDPRTGRFIRKPAVVVPSVPDDVDLILRADTPAARARQLRRMTEDQLLDLSTQISGQDSLTVTDQASLLAIYNEMDRRDRAAGRDGPADDATPDERRIDDLIARGWDYADAYAEVHGQDPEQLRRQQADAVIDRRAGETKRQAIRRAYGDYIHLQLLAAEQATRGHMLTRPAQRAGIDPVTLFSGPATRARKWASEDLKRWWADNPRMTFAEFSAQLDRRRGDRQAAQRVRTGGNDRDFGV